MKPETIEAALLITLRMLIEQDVEIEALRGLILRLDSEGTLDQEAIDRARKSVGRASHQLLLRLQSFDSQAFLWQIDDILQVLERTH